MPKLAINDFRGGMNSRVPGNVIADNEVQDLLNFEYTATGRLRSRQGKAIYNITGIGSGGAITGIFLCKFSDGTRKMVVSEGTGLYVDDGSGAFTAIKTGLTSGQYVSHAMFADQAIFVNGANAPMTYDGTTVSDLANAPAGASFVAAHREHLFMIGATADKYKIYASALRDPTDWSTADDSWTGYCAYQDGYPPISLLSFMDTYLYVFSRQWIGRVKGSTGDSSSANVFTPEIVARLTGTVSPFSVVAVGSDAFFFDVEGVKSLADTERAAGIEYPNMSFKVQDKVNDLNASKYSQFYGVNHKAKNQYWLCLTGSGQTSNSKVLVLDYALRTEGSAGILLPAATFFSHKLTCVALIEDANGADILFGGTADGNIYTLDTGEHDNNAGFTKRLKTKAYDFEAPDLYKQFPWLFLRLKMGQSGSYNYGLSWILDLDENTGGSTTIALASISPTYQSVGGGGGTGIYGQSIYGPQLVNKNRVMLSRYGLTRGQNIAFTLSNASASQGMELIEMVLTGNPRGEILN